MKIRTADDLERVRPAGLRRLIPTRPRIAVGLGTCGKAVGGDQVYDRLRQAIESGGLDIALTRVGCFGYCREEPLVNIAIPGKPLVILPAPGDGRRRRFDRPGGPGGGGAR